jgi:acetolactate synthase I/II/III large subunit
MTTTKTLKADTVAEAYLQLLHDRGVEYFLGNAGTDFASIVDAFARFAAEKTPAPRPLLIPHEFVAVSMAHGYYLGKGRPLAVMVHVNVGTANASTAIISAARANVPILMSAGRTPITEEGLPGARDLHIHWAQESFDQAAMLREYVKWDYELRTPVQLESVVDRALEIMLAEPRGPVYLSLPREVLAARVPSVTITSPSRRQTQSEHFPDPARIDEAARLLAAARSPLILTSSSGRDPRAVTGLVALAEAGGIGVVEADPTHLNFPARHSLHLGYNQSGTTNPSVADADVILVIDADVPWYPALVKPHPDCRVIHLAVDPFFSRYPMRSYPCDVPIVATPAVALPMLADAVRRHADPPAVAARSRAVAAEHQRRLQAWDAAATAQAAKSTIGFAWVSRCIEEILDDDTVVVNEYPLDRRFAAFTRPGSYFASPHSSGLGFGFGAALGVKLADPTKTVIATLGDGAYFFAEPMSCHFVQRAHRLPLLTVIFNNQRWEAVKSAALGLHPDGWAKSTGQFPLTSLTPSPRFEEVVKAFDGHGERVETPAEVGPALKRALGAVREGRQAVLNILCQRVPE